MKPTIVIENAIAVLPRECRNEWAEIVSSVHDPLDVFSSWSLEHRKTIIVAWSDWVREQNDAREVLRSISTWSPRLGMLLACRVAREAIRIVPEDDGRPLHAIETAERWVNGEATAEECKRAADEAYAVADATADAAAAADTADHYAAYTAASDAHAAAAYASYAATTVADVDTLAVAAYAYESGDYAAAAASATALAAAAAYAPYSDNWNRTRTTELHRLCGVIAEDLLTGRTA